MSTSVKMTDTVDRTLAQFETIYGDIEALFSTISADNARIIALTEFSATKTAFKNAVLDAKSLKNQREQDLAVAHARGEFGKACLHHAIQNDLVEEMRPITAKLLSFKPSEEQSEEREEPIPA